MILFAGRYVIVLINEKRDSLRSDSPRLIR